MGKVALLADVEHDDRDIIVAAQRHGAGVHDLQIVGQDAVESDAFITLCARHLLRIGIIDAVYRCPLEQRIALHLGGAERGARIGGEKRRPDASSEDHHPSFFEMAFGATADKGFAHAGHRNGGLDARVDADLLERVLHRERVHHGREHAHIVGGRALNPLGGGGQSAKDIAPADDHAQFEARVARLGNLARDARGHRRIDRQPVAAHQHLARQFQEDAFEGRLRHALTGPI